jgi:two-component system sensor histidine kinase KdpD
MRTPLTAIRGYATTVLEYADRLDKGDIVEYVGGIEAAAQQLEKIVADLLTLTRIESGVLRFDLEDLDLNQVAAHAVQSYRMANPKHDVVLETAERAPFVRVDASRMTQVFHNLLDNARKYGGDHHVLVNVQCEGDEAMVTVRDSGPGISPAELSRIFEPFTRGMNVKSAGVTGSGLGLAICKAILEAQGGNISANLPKDGGFEVCVRLPLSEAFDMSVAQGL